MKEHHFDRDANLLLDSDRKRPHITLLYLLKKLLNCIMNKIVKFVATYDSFKQSGFSASDVPLQQSSKVFSTHADKFNQEFNRINKVTYNV